MHELLERDELLAELEAARRARGRLVFVGGEAGVGKTSLVRRFADGVEEHVLWGSCDPLFTPRALGPLVEVAAVTGGQLREVVAGEPRPHDVLEALVDELHRRPTVLVVEDAHWADEATLDVLRVLGRRAAASQALAIVTHRDELAAAHPLRIVLGELATAPAVRRLTVPPLSFAAVDELAQSAGLDGQELHRLTAGNPFFVTEVIATGAGGIPATVRDAVLARAAALPVAARALLEAVAVSPPRAEHALLERVAPNELAQAAACVSAGMLVEASGAFAFRHELARRAIEQTVPPSRRVELHRAIVGALAGSGDAARLAHHAEAAGDAQAVLAHAPAAAETAARLGAHREAAAQYERALRFADGLPANEVAGLLERRGYECYLTNDIEAAIEARRRALVLRRESGDRLAEGENLRWLSRLSWFVGRNAEAEEAGAAAVELLEQLPPGRELAMAYSNQAHLRMLASDREETAAWGARAMELADRLGETEVLVHALNNVGSVHLIAGAEEGRAMLERSLELALADDLEEHVARAFTNLGSASVLTVDYERADEYLRRGDVYTTEHDLDSWRLYMLAWRARLELERGRWDAAAAAAEEVLAHPRSTAVARIPALVVLGLVRLRRGDPDASPPIDEALLAARETGELQRIAPAVLAAAERAWLQQDTATILELTEAPLQDALARTRAWDAGELAFWRWRAGGVGRPPPAIAHAYALRIAGDHRAAAEEFTRIGRPYEAADALSDVGDEESLRRALEEFERLGARPAAARAAKRLRELGVRDIPRGPRAATRANAAGLTPREAEVLGLVADGLRNVEIAERLVISEKTVDHHVSAILRKLGARTRTEAVRLAAKR